MQRVAILVDAGHLFAQGSAALAGSSQPRHQVQIDAKRVVDALSAHCDICASGCSLLRVYWYDGVGIRGPTHDHEKLAATNNIKMRLGFINSQGKQKGVDSLIVTDLIELARNKAISDAILLAGDEDLRIGVQVAQSYGVRVHLLGIHPARGSQSKQLIAEADTTYEWTKEVISKFMSVTPGLSTSLTSVDMSPIKITPTAIIVPERAAGDPTPTVLQCADDFAAALHLGDVAAILQHWQESSQLPKAVDGKLLASTRDRIGVDLSSGERRDLRRAFVSAVQRLPNSK